MQATAAFEDVERMLHGIVHNAVKRYNLDHSITLSEAFYGFLQAFDTYSPDKGAFTTWAWTKASRRILDLVRKRAEDLKKPPVTTDIDLDLIFKEHPQKFNLEDWLEDLTPDANYVAKLVFYIPSDIKASLVQLRSDSPANWRFAIREFLSDQEWSDERIKMAFREIKEKL
jgi:DNA-directed RNA polymerase specialized sigma24 family protein